MQGGKAIAFPFYTSLTAIQFLGFSQVGLSSQLQRWFSTRGMGCLELGDVGAFRERKLIDAKLCQFRVWEFVKVDTICFHSMLFVLWFVYLMKGKIWQRGIHVLY